MRKTLVLVAVLALVVSGCSGDDPVADESPEPPNLVTMIDNRFLPSIIQVAPGDVVMFEVTDNVAHTVTAVEKTLPEDTPYFASGGFTSEAAARDDVAGGFMKKGDRFEVSFEQPGVYEYICIPHVELGMTGKILVEE